MIIHNSLLIFGFAIPKTYYGHITEQKLGSPYWRISVICLFSSICVNIIPRVRWWMIKLQKLQVIQFRIQMTSKFVLSFHGSWMCKLMKTIVLASRGEHPVGANQRLHLISSLLIQSSFEQLLRSKICGYSFYVLSTNNLNTFSRCTARKGIRQKTHLMSWKSRNSTFIKFDSKQSRNNLRNVGDFVQKQFCAISRISSWLQSFS